MSALLKALLATEVGRFSLIGLRMGFVIAMVLAGHIRRRLNALGPSPQKA